MDNPDSASVNVRPCTVSARQATNEEEPEAHQGQTNKKHRATTPLINIDDSRNGESDVQNVLDGLEEVISTSESD